MRFQMSGQIFNFDERPELLTAEEVFAVEDEVGMPLDELLELVASGFESGRVVGRALRAICGLAWLAHRRAGGSLSWKAFTRTIAPATIAVIPDEPPSPPAAGGDGGPQRPSATRQRPKARAAKSA